MHPEPAPPPAGWYDDPASDGLRWWDGAQWTANRQPKDPPLHAAPSQPGPTHVPGPVPVPAAEPATVTAAHGRPGGGSGDVPGAKEGTSGKAIAAAICPVLLGPIGALPAVVLAILALRELAANPRRGGRVLAIVGLVIGGLQVLVLSFAVLAIMVAGTSGSTASVNDTRMIDEQVAAQRTALEYVRAIQAGDGQRACSLMSPEHVQARFGSAVRCATQMSTDVTRAQAAKLSLSAPALSGAIAVEGRGAVTFRPISPQDRPSTFQIERRGERWLVIGDQG